MVASRARENHTSRTATLTTGVIRAETCKKRRKNEYLATLVIGMSFFDLGVYKPLNQKRTN
jgi:hypothetical protein